MRRHCIRILELAGKRDSYAPRDCVFSYNCPVGKNSLERFLILVINESMRSRDMVVGNMVMRMIMKIRANKGG